MYDDSRLINSVYNTFLVSSILAILFNATSQIVNNLVIGNAISSEKLSVTGLVLPIYYVFATLGNMMGIGGSILCSKLIGQGCFERCKHAFTVTYVFTVAVSMALGALTFLMLPQIIPLLGTPEALYHDVYQYAAVMCVGGVFTACIYLAFNFLRLDAKALSAMLVFVVMAALGAGLDYVFVVRMGLGLFGVSLATSIAAAAASVMGALILFLKGDSVRLARMDAPTFFALTGELIKIGSPGAGENVCILCKSLVLNRLLASAFGAMALSAYSVTGSVNAFALAFICGAAGTIAPFVGVFGTEKDTGSVRKVLRQALIKGGALTGAVTLLCLIFPGQIARLFGMTSGDGLQMAQSAVRIFALSFPLALMNNILISLHLANGRTLLANVLTALRNFVLIAAFALALTGSMGVNGVWNSFWMAEAATLLVAICWHLAVASKDKNLSPLTLLDESTEKNGSCISFTVSNSVESIMESVEKISAFCEDNELNMKKAMRVSLALEEMLTSIKNHALGDNALLTMNVRIIILEGVVVLRIRNRGALFNPLAYYAAKKHGEDMNLEAALDLEDSLGIKMIVDACEVVDYRTTFGINNLTVIL